MRNPTSQVRQPVGAPSRATRGAIGGPLPKSWGFLGTATGSPFRESPGHSLPPVALMRQWRQNSPNNRTHRPEAVAAEMGQLRPPALRKRRSW